MILSGDILERDVKFCYSQLKLKHMKIVFDTNVASRYKSASQKIRVLTEDWVGNEVYCPSCGMGINHYENNRPVADFFCPNCSEEYELKSKKDSIGVKIVDGAYRTMKQQSKLFPVKL